MYTKNHKEHDETGSYSLLGNFKSLLKDIGIIY